jgi:small subunit ribosomal protein S24e
MDSEIVSEKNNPLLKRKELKVKLSHPGAKTPTRAGVKEHIASKLSAKKDRIIVDSMKSYFGKNETFAYVKIYESPEDVKNCESEHILKRNTSATKKEDKAEKEEAPAKEQKEGE